MQALEMQAEVTEQREIRLKLPHDIMVLVTVDRKICLYDLDT